MIAVHKLNSLTRTFLMASLMLSALVVFSGMSFAGTTVQGCGDNKSITLNSSTNWKSLCSQTLTFTTTQNCVLTGSAQVHNDVASVHNEYRFTVDKDINPLTGKKGEKVVDVTQSSGADAIDLAVSPVNNLKNLAPGTYTFRILGRKFDTADDINVTSYSLGVVCTDAN